MLGIERLTSLVNLMHIWVYSLDAIVLYVLFWSIGLQSLVSMEQLGEVGCDCCVGKSDFIRGH